MATTFVVLALFAVVASVQCDIAFQVQVPFPQNLSIVGPLAAYNSVLAVPLYSVQGANCPLGLFDVSNGETTLTQLDSYLLGPCSNNWTTSIAMDNQFIAIGTLGTVIVVSYRSVNATVLGTVNSDYGVLNVAKFGESVAFVRPGNDVFLLVGTESSALSDLGYISVFNYDATSQSFVKYTISTNNLLPYVLADSYLMAGQGSLFAIYGSPSRSVQSQVYVLNSSDWSVVASFSTNSPPQSLALCGSIVLWSTDSEMTIRSWLLSDSYTNQMFASTSVHCSAGGDFVTVTASGTGSAHVTLLTRWPDTLNFEAQDVPSPNAAETYLSSALTDSYLFIDGVNSSSNYFVDVYNVSNHNIVTGIVLIAVFCGSAVIAAAIIGVIFGLKRWKHRKKVHEEKGRQNGEESQKVVAVRDKQENGRKADSEVEHGATYQGMPAPSQENSTDKMASSTRESAIFKMNSSVDVKDRLRVPWNEIKIVRDIGKGSYGKVCLGKWRHTDVAVKFCNDIGNVEDFLREAELMINIPPHPNIVQVLGISTDGPLPVIMLEYCAGGSLDKYLFGTDIQLTEETTISLVAGIAKGMLHLHKNNIIHRDLAARNILLTEAKQPKISDFGMSRLLQQQQEGKTNTNVGPLRWMAPESLADRTYSTKSDVWTFGIVVWEIVAKQEPHLDQDPLNVGKLIRDEFLVPKIPSQCPPILAEIMQMCWKPKPDERPDFEEICKLLLKD
jgi:predicted Ser/Thr protein kinase